MKQLLFTSFVALLTFALFGCDRAKLERLMLPDELRECACAYYTAQGHESVELYCAIARSRKELEEMDANEQK